MSITDIDTASDSVQFVGHDSCVYTAAISPDGKHIASGSGDAAVRLWDIETKSTILKPFIGHRLGVKSVAFSPDGRCIVSGSDDRTLRLWDTRTGTDIARPFLGHTHCVKSVAFSPDGQYIASGSYDTSVRLWDVKMRKTVFEPFTGHSSKVTSVAFSSGGKHIISGSIDCTICLWDTTTGYNISTRYANRSDPIGGHLLGFSHNGNFIASGSPNCHIRLHDLNATKNVTKSFQGHTRRVVSVAFSPDGKHIVSGSDDRTIRLWDTATGSTILGPHKGHTGDVLSVGFSSDGKYIVSTSNDGTIRLWRTPSPSQCLDIPFSKSSPFCLDGKVSNRSPHSVAGGAYSDVWKGSFGEDVVAIKVIRPFTEDGSPIESSKLVKQLWREYRAWSNLSHPNVLDCLGFSYDFSPDQEVPSLISRWMKNGEVLPYLKKHPDANRLKIVIGIASGLAYLHNKNPAIVHGDVRAGNVLVSNDGTPCLTDFGLSRVISKTQGSSTSSNTAGSLRWMAPERIRGGKANSQGDVWAYGMTVLEIFTGSRPFKGINLEPVVMFILLDGNVPERPAPATAPALTDAVWITCNKCWNIDPTQRPSASEVYEELARGNRNA